LLKFNEEVIHMAEEMSKEMADKVLEAIEIARTTGKIKKGANEATKAIERGQAKLVAYASDVQPPEVVMHLPLLSKEKGIKCYKIGTKEELGAAAGLQVGTTAVAITLEGDAKNLLKELA
jgi:large subunit ribosomal protein L7Ae